MDSEHVENLEAISSEFPLFRQPDRQLGYLASAGLPMTAYSATWA